MPDVAHYTDYAAFAVDLHDFPKRILAGEERARHGLIDQDYRLGRRSIPFRHVAAGAQWNSHRLYVTVGHYPHKRIGEFPLRVHLPLSWRAPTAVPAQWQRIG